MPTRFLSLTPEEEDKYGKIGEINREILCTKKTILYVLWGQNIRNNNLGTINIVPELEQICNPRIIRLLIKI